MTEESRNVIKKRKTSNLHKTVDKNWEYNDLNYVI